MPRGAPASAAVSSRPAVTVTKSTRRTLPPGAERSRLLRWLHREAPVPWGTDPAEWERHTVADALWVARLILGEGRPFPLDARGFERIPPPPVLLVSNHSGGTTIPDVWGFAVAWYRHFSLRRPLHPAAHEIILSTPFTGRLFSQLGVIRAQRRVVRATLRDGRDVLVMPGGDRDVWRPHRDRWRVRFAGHRGYARIAAELGVPVVPIANAGAHDTFFVLADGHRLARLLGLHAIARADVWPLHLSIPWGLTLGPWPHLPWPRTLRYRVGDPIEPPPDPEDAAAIEALDGRVRGAIQGMLDDLRWEVERGDEHRDGRAHA